MSELAKRAMLVDLCIHQPKRTTIDQQATESLALQRGAKKQAIKVTKRIWGDMYAPVEAAINRSTEQHKRLTSPWITGGASILSAKVFDQYMASMRSCEDSCKAALEAFLEKYTDAREQALSDLGDMACEEDYPSASSMRNRFGFSIRFFPVPTAGDWRVELDADQMKILKQQIEQQQADIVKASSAATIGKLYDALMTITERVAECKITEAGIKSLMTTIENLELLDIDTTGEFEKTLKKVKALLNNRSAETLRTDDTVAEAFIDEADEIADKMAAYMKNL